MVTYTSAVLAAANLLAVAQAAPSWSGSGKFCQVVVDVIEGPGFWVPSPDPTTTWSAWDPKDTTTSSTATWSTWDPKDTTTSSTSASWTAWTESASASSTSTSSTYTWTGKHATYTPSTTTVAPSTTPYTSHTTYSTHTTSSSTTSTTTPAAAPTCASSTYDFNYTPSGSCGCEFTVDCNVHASYGANTKFWEQTSGQIVDTLAQCVQMCNNNSACEATVWSASDPSDTQDYKRCWQISGLGADASTGFGQISRKGSCSGKCSLTYSG